MGAIAGPAFGQTLDLPAPPRATLLGLTLTPGGSADPAGDRLVADVLVYPGIEKVDLALEAEYVDRPAPPEPGEGPKGVPGRRLVKAKGEVHRAPDGSFRLEAVATGKGDGAAHRVALVVPRAELDVAPGGGPIRYTLRGSVDGAEAFDGATGPILDPGSPGVAFPPDDRSPPLPPPEVLDPDAKPDVSRAGNEAGLGGSPGIDPTPRAPSKSMPLPQAPVKTMPAPQAPAAQQDASFQVLPRRPILFATNRAVRATQGTPSERFGNSLGGLSYGVCLVNIPVKAHIRGTLELPGWFNSADPDRYFQIEATNLLADRAVFQDLVRGAEARGDVLVYVHGFNTSFDFAVLKLAQVVHDIKFPGVPVAFSWPSRAEVYSYDSDEANALLSGDALADMLLSLIAAQDARPEARRGKVHVLAHSLGNRVALRALEKLDRDPKLAAGRKPFGQVILAAPDVSVSEFVGRLSPARARADRVSLYFCPDDRALLASQIRHPGEPRAGRGVVPLPGLDNIDARKANTSFLGHGYWSEVKEMLIDLQMLINLGWEPGKRETTLDPTPLNKPVGYLFWSFR